MKITLNFIVYVCFLMMFPFQSGGSTKQFTKEELKQRLTPLQYHVTQEKGTERYDDS